MIYKAHFGSIDKILNVFIPNLEYGAAPDVQARLSNSPLVEHSGCFVSPVFQFIDPSEEFVLIYSWTGWTVVGLVCPESKTKERNRRVKI